MAVTTADGALLAYGWSGRSATAPARRRRHHGVPRHGRRAAGGPAGARRPAGVPARHGAGDLVVATAVHVWGAPAGEVSLETWRSNTGARRLYADLGFVQVPEAPDHPDVRPTLQPVGAEVARRGRARRPRPPRPPPRRRRPLLLRPSRRGLIARPSGTAATHRRTLDRMRPTPDRRPTCGRPEPRPPSRRPTATVPSGEPHPRWRSLRHPEWRLVSAGPRRRGARPAAPRPWCRRGSGGVSVPTAQPSTRSARAGLRASAGPCR